MNAHDPLVVRTAELAAVLRVWCDKHNGRFSELNAPWKPGVHGGPGGGGFKEVASISAIQYIHLHAANPPIGLRMLARILTGESKHTEFRYADSILSIIGETSALHNGLIEILPNPAWSREKWQEWKESQGHC